MLTKIIFPLFLIGIACFFSACQSAGSHPPQSPVSTTSTSNSSSASARHYFEEAMKIYNAKKSDFETPLYNWTNGIEGWGDSKLEYSEIVKVREYLDKALDEDESFVDAYIKRGQMYILSDADMSETGNYDAITLAQEDFSKAIALDPNNAEAYFYRASCYSWSTEKDKVLANLNKAIEKNPNYADAYAVRSQFYEQEKDMEKSKKDREKAHNLMPEKY